MLTFKYTARDPRTDEKVHGELQADDELAVAKAIKSQGLSPLDIKQVDSGDSFFDKFFNKIKTKEKILFSRQLSTLINAGLPLVQSLSSVAKQAQSKPLKAVINGVIADVEGGSSLSAALAKYPQVFSQIYISLISSGEASGTLDKSLERLANQQEKDAEITGKVRSAMIYPAIVMFVMVLVMGFMIVQVLPQVGDLYDTIPGAQLPILTRILLFVAHIITNYWWGVGIGFAIMVVGGVKFAKTMTGKRLFDKVKMKAGPIGKLFMKLYMARFARTGTTLVASGVPLIQTLEITAKAVNNVHISDSIMAAIEKVKGGKSLAVSLRGDDSFLPLVPDMLEIGESSGSVEEMLERVAIYYEKEVDNEIKAISTIIEPVLMIVLGVFALIIVAAVLLPIYGLANQNVF